MKLSPIFCASLVALALSSTVAFAGEECPCPISGTPVGLEGDPGSIVITHGVTDNKGNINFGKLAPGKYVAVIDGRSLVAAIDRLAPSTPAQENGKSRHSPSAREQGGGPAGASHGNSHSNDGSSAASSGDLSGTWSVTEGRGSEVRESGTIATGGVVLNLPWSSGDKFSTTYRRETALREGIRIKFTVPFSPETATSDALGRIIFVGATIKY